MRARDLVADDGDGSPIFLNLESRFIKEVSSTVSLFDQ